MKRFLLLGLLAGCGTVTTGDQLPDGGAPSPPPSEVDAGDALALSIAVPGATTFVRVSGTASIQVTLSRGATTGDVVVTATTDAAGITFDPLTIPAGTSTGVLTVRAAADAPFARADVTIRAVVGTADATTAASATVIGQPGALDTSFGERGQVSLYWLLRPVIPFDVFATGDQYVLVAPERVIRLAANGLIDEQFGIDGAVEPSPNALGLSGVTIGAMAALPSGRIVIAGHGQRAGELDLGAFTATVTRAGQPDPGRPAGLVFAQQTTDERVIASSPGPDESTYLLMQISSRDQGNSRTVLARIRSDGQPDPGFRQLEMPEGTGTRMVPLANGDAMTFGGGALHRVTPQGELSSAFGQRGSVTFGGYSRVYDVTELADGRIVATGTDGGNIKLTRLHGDGRLDESFGEQGTLKFVPATEFQEHGVQLRVESDGSAYGGGFNDEYSPYVQRLRLFRLTAEGTADAAYGPNGGVIDTYAWKRVDTITFGDDHRVLVTGLLYEDRETRPIARRYWY
jgi:uncharacterized delta-60 repeat protein